MFYKGLHHMFGTADSPSATQNISNLYTTAYVHVEWWRALRRIISVEISWKIRLGPGLALHSTRLCLWIWKYQQQ